VFENVSLGEHIITIWDVKGGLENSCDPFIIDEVQTIDYPHFFTPNGDGINDTWNINGLSNQPEAKIHIFDRHGKLLKQVSSKGIGWDGTYNGQPLPATDYWFTVDYAEQILKKQYKAHFTLKR
jgi:gliding motility-associated-like protein